MTPETQKCVDFFKLKLAAAHGEAPIPDELCEHVEMGAEMAGGVVFTAETPLKAVGMCQPCLDWCNANFAEPRPLNKVS